MNKTELKETLFKYKIEKLHEELNNLEYDEKYIRYNNVERTFIFDMRIYEEISSSDVELKIKLDNDV